MRPTPPLTVRGPRPEIKEPLAAQRHGTQVGLRRRVIGELMRIERQTVDAELMPNHSVILQKVFLNALF